MPVPETAPDDVKLDQVRLSNKYDPPKGRREAYFDSRKYESIEGIFLSTDYCNNSGKLCSYYYVTTQNRLTLIVRDLFPLRKTILLHCAHRLAVLGLRIGQRSYDSCNGSNIRRAP